MPQNGQLTLFKVEKNKALCFYWLSALFDEEKKL